MPIPQPAIPIRERAIREPGGSVEPRREGNENGAGSGALGAERGRRGQSGQRKDREVTERRLRDIALPAVRARGRAARWERFLYALLSLRAGFVVFNFAFILYNCFCKYLKIITLIIFLIMIFITTFYVFFSEATRCPLPGSQEEPSAPPRTGPVAAFRSPSRGCRRGQEPLRTHGPGPRWGRPWAEPAARRGAAGRPRAGLCGAAAAIWKGSERKVDLFRTRGREVGGSEGEGRGWEVCVRVGQELFFSPSIILTNDPVPREEK